MFLEVIFSLFFAISDFDIYFFIIYFLEIKFYITEEKFKDVIVKLES